MLTRYEVFFDNIRNGGVAILDGGVATELESRGVPMKNGTWSGLASIYAWDTLIETHRAYIDSGSNIITANTYASSRLMLGTTGASDHVRNVNLKSLEAAQIARQQSGCNDVLIAGSISHALPYIEGAVGATQQPNIPNETLRTAFDEMVEIHEVGGADLILLEMLSLPARMKPLLESVKKSSLPTWCGLSAKQKTPNTPITAWHDQNVLFSKIIEMTLRYDFDVLGIMHTTAELISIIIPELKQKYKGPIMVYPDSGFFKAPNWQFESAMSPIEFRHFSEDWLNQGVQIIGGCCGLGTEHIQAISDLRSQVQ
jgi:homocysteine S-methyltransferase